MTPITRRHVPGPAVFDDREAMSFGVTLDEPAASRIARAYADVLRTAPAPAA